MFEIIDLKIVKNERETAAEHTARCAAAAQQSGGLKRKMVHRTRCIDAVNMFNSKRSSV